MTNSIPNEQEGSIESIRYMQSTTQTGVDECLSFCRRAQRNAGGFMPLHMLGPADSALVEFDYGEDIPTDPPFAFLKGKAGWVRAVLLRPTGSSEPWYCVSAVSDDDGSPFRFDMLQQFFKYVTSLRSSPEIPEAIESHLSNEVEEHRCNILHNLKRDYEVSSEITLKPIRSKLWQLRGDHREIKKRLSELRKELSELRLRTESKSTQSLASPNLSDDSTSHEYLDRQTEQSQLRLKLSEIEDQELELQATKCSLEQDPYAEWTLKPLFTIRWVIH